MSINDISIPDLRHYFAGCLIEYKESPKLSNLIYINDVVMRDNIKYFLGNSITRTGNYGSERVVPINSPELYWRFPKLGFINTPNLCVYLSRRTSLKGHSRFKRALSEEAILVNNIARTSLPGLTPEGIEKFFLPTRALLFYLYHNTFDTLSSAINKLHKGVRLNCAIDLDWAIGISPRYDELILYYKYFIPFGYITVDKEYIAHIPPYYSEFIDKLTKLGFNVNIEKF